MYRYKSTWNRVGHNGHNPESDNLDVIITWTSKHMSKGVA